MDPILLLHCFQYKYHLFYISLLLSIINGFRIFHVKRKSAFELVQNPQIHTILRVRKVSSGPLLSVLDWHSSKKPDPFKLRPTEY